MANGIIKWFNEKKGYEFIKQEDGPDVVVHHSGTNADETALLDKVRIGDERMVVNIIGSDRSYFRK